MSLENPKDFRLRVMVTTVLALCLASAACESEAQKAAKAKVLAEKQAYRERYAKAKALFEERCKTAGVVIHRIVKDVEGIELTKVRQPIPWGGREYFDPMFPGAAMAGEVSGIDYIKQFLMYEYRATFAPQTRGQFGPPTAVHRDQLLPPTPGYRFVEVSDPDGTRYRYSPVWTPGQSNWVDGQHKREPVQSSATRYALDYEDLVDPADRAHWVAGTKLRVIDKRNGEAIAELTRFVFDPGFGGSSTGRWPWSHAATSGSGECPSIVGVKQYVSRTFVDTVLIPKQGD